MRKINMNLLYQHMGKRIRALRQLRQLNIPELAKIIHLDRGFLAQIERGVGVPSVKTLAHLAAALDVPLKEFCQENLEGPSQEFMVRETTNLLRRQGPKERIHMLALLRELAKLTHSKS